MTQVLVVVASGEVPSTEAVAGCDISSAAAGPPLDVVVVEFAVVGPTAAEAVHGWDILGHLEGPALVHVCHPFTKAGETAVLAAKLLGKKIVLSDFEPRTSAVGQSLGLTDLADCLVCRSEEEAAAFAAHRRVEVLPSSASDSGSAIGAVYVDLLRDTEQAG